MLVKEKSILRSNKSWTSTKQTIWLQENVSDTYSNWCTHSECTESALCKVREQETKTNFPCFWDMHAATVPKALWSGLWGCWGFFYIQLSWFMRLLVKFYCTSGFFFGSFEVEKHHFCSRCKSEVLMEHKYLRGHDFMALKWRAVHCFIFLKKIKM